MPKSKRKSSQKEVAKKRARTQESENELVMSEPIPVAEPVPVVFPAVPPLQTVGMMADADIDDIWNNADMMKWLKGVLVMNITDKAIRPFVENQIKNFLFDIKSNFKHGTLCGKCKSTNARDCLLGICSDITTKIELIHRFSRPCYKNSDITKWLSDHWEIAKCFMSWSKDLKGKPGSDIDFSSVLNVVINNRHFEGIITAVDMSNDNNIFCKGRKARNKAMHSRSHQMTEHDLNDYCDIFIDIVNEIGTDKAECLRKIKEVRDTQLSITAEDIVKLKEQAARYQGLAKSKIKELKKKWREEMKKGESLIPSFIEGCKKCFCKLTIEHIQRLKPESTGKVDWTVGKVLEHLQILVNTENLSERHREMLFPSSGPPLDIELWDIYLYCFVLNLELNQPLYNRTLLFMNDAKVLRDNLLANPFGVDKSQLLNLCDCLDNPLKNDILMIFERERTVTDMVYANNVLQSWKTDEKTEGDLRYKRVFSQTIQDLSQTIEDLRARISQLEKNNGSARTESDEGTTGRANESFETTVKLKPTNVSQADKEKFQNVITSPSKNNHVLQKTGAYEHFENSTNNSSITSIAEGSIILKVSCPSIKSLFGFWEGCTDGTVVKAMSKIRDAYRKHLGCDALEFDIVLKKEEVTRCTNLIIGDLNSRLKRLETQAADVDDPLCKSDKKAKNKSVKRPLKQDEIQDKKAKNKSVKRPLKQDDTIEEEEGEEEDSDETNNSLGDEDDQHFANLIQDKKAKNKSVKRPLKQDDTIEEEEGEEEDSDETNNSLGDEDDQHFANLIQDKKAKNKSVKRPLKQDDTIEEEEGEEEDSDETNNSLGDEDDQHFANLIQGVKHDNLCPSLLNVKSTSVLGALDVLTPPKVKKDTVWSFPLDFDDEEEWTSVKGSKLEARHLMQSIAVELYRSQIEVAKYLELAYLGVSDHPDVAKEVRLTAHSARTQHMMTTGLMKSFMVTVKHIVGTMMPMIFDAVDLEDKDLVRDCFAQIITRAEEMKQKAVDTRQNYYVIQTNVQSNLDQVNTKNKFVSDEQRRLDIEKDEAQELAAENLKAYRDKYTLETETASKAMKEEDDKTFLDYLIVPPHAAAGPIGITMSIMQTGVNIISSMFGRNKKMKQLKKRVKAQQQAQENLDKVSSEKQEVHLKMQDQKRAKLERLSKIKKLNVEASLVDAKSLQEASSCLGEVDRQFSRIITFWNNMVVTLKFLNDDTQAGEVYLKNLKNPKYAERFKASITRAENGWNCFGKICGDYVFACENDENVAIEVLYNFLSASIEAVSAPERRMRMDAIADEIEENIDFEEDEKE